jgi:hypothetical protein
MRSNVTPFLWFVAAFMFAAVWKGQGKKRIPGPRVGLRGPCCSILYRDEEGASRGLVIAPIP